MLFILKNSWALLLGMMLLMVGNGLQGTLLGIRGAIEGYDATTMAWVMSGYYLGFLVGTRRIAAMIRRVGHVRVFSALASLVSAAFILYALDPSPALWVAMRFVIGFCFAGIYVVAESWLNEAATNETRGQALSLYMIVQMVGIISAQALLNLADPAGYSLFIVMSVLVSVSFAPILLTVSTAPAYLTTKPMTLRQLFAISPLGCVGTFALGGVYAAIFSMASVFGTQKGLDVGEIASFVAAIYLGGLVCQFPIGWISDRIDRRVLIIGMTAAGAVASFGFFFLPDRGALLLVGGFLVGGIANPLYALLIAYTNDFLDPADMPAASGGLLFINGLGAISGPFLIGWLMTRFGADTYFLYLAGLFGLVAGYGAYRMWRRPSRRAGRAYAPVLPQSSPVALEVAQGVAIDWAAGAVPADQGELEDDAARA
ncbi:MFS transporter [uncultured Amaricoccus sp.]|uniref:MFS transporter n=1 Tax=uncultured Amaricoccus sp. TaxID=339341 RepID=UPI00262E3A06|nr:MFS transporter [uncultured Amaricoccus sp.]